MKNYINLILTKHQHLTPHHNKLNEWWKNQSRSKAAERRDGWVWKGNGINRDLDQRSPNINWTLTQTATNWTWQIAESRWKTLNCRTRDSEVLRSAKRHWSTKWRSTQISQWHCQLPRQRKDSKIGL
jgi:hypothetical protein